MRLHTDLGESLILRSPRLELKTYVSGKRGYFFDKYMSRRFRTLSFETRCLRRGITFDEAIRNINATRREIDAAG